MREKQDLPKIFHETLTRQFGEIIRETEELVDKGYILMTHEKIFDLISKHSDKIRDYSKIEVYRDWFSRSDDDDGMYTLSERAFEIQKRYFIKTDEEIQTSENILATLRSEPYFHGSDRCDDIFYFEDISHSEDPHYYLHPSCISDIGTIFHEFYDFKRAHKIPCDVCSSYFILSSLVKNSTSREYEIVSNGTALFKVEKNNPLEVISQYAAKNYIQNVIGSINYNIEADRDACSFLLKEIYKATRLYTSDDIDKHLTTDIPVYPYTEGQTEVLGVYYYKPEDTDVCEYLFITNKDCFSVHLKIDYPFRDWFHTTQVIEYGSVATVFGSERTINLEELTMLNGLVIGETPIRYVDNLELNESTLLEFCRNEHYQHFNSEISNYFIQHKGAWIQSPVKLKNDYAISVEGIERERLRENGEICLTEEEKSALEQQRLNATPAQLHAPEPEQEETQDFHDFNFGGEPDESLSVKDYGIITTTIDKHETDESQPQEKRKFKKSVKFVMWTIPVLIAAYLFFG
ncbi:hypothetical protein [Pseudomonas sp. NY8896]|uniref:hypothetical protein n=1 Tax=Pseudomonas sp. NY8896 TaxID=3068639 RepID=UPI0031F6B83A